MPKLEIKYTDYKEICFYCQSWKFDQSQLIVEHGDLSTEYINRTVIRSMRVWKDDIPV